jgi:hypothetical protein
MDNNNNSSSKKTGTSKRKKKNPFRVMAFVWISLLLFFCHLLCNPVCADSWWSLGRAQHTHLRRHLFFFNRKWEKGNLILLVSNAEKWIYLNNNYFFFLFSYFLLFSLSFSTNMDTAEDVMGLAALHDGCAAKNWGYQDDRHGHYYFTEKHKKVSHVTIKTYFLLFKKIKMGVVLLSFNL